MKKLLDDPKVLVNLIIAIMGLLSALGVHVGVDNTTVQTTLVGICAIYNGIAHGVAATQGD